MNIGETAQSLLNHRRICGWWSWEYTRITLIIDSMDRAHVKVSHLGFPTDMDIFVKAHLASVRL